MLRTGASLTGLLGLIAGATPRAAPERPSEEALRAIEAVGRRIASYHEAVARARQRFQDSDPAQGVRMVVVDRNGAWRVIVMRVTEGRAGAKGWQMLAEIGFNPKAGEVTTIQRLNPPKQAPSDAVAALHAIDAAVATILSDVPEAEPPFEEAIFREGERTFAVYLQTSSEGAGAARFGADLLAQVTPDGMRVLKSSALHGTDEGVLVSSNSSGAPTLHSHVEGDLPTETDVALVIEHPGLAPHLVLTPRHMFRIDATGAITYLGPNEVPPAAPDGVR